MLIITRYLDTKAKWLIGPRHDDRSSFHPSHLKLVDFSSSPQGPIMHIHKTELSTQKSESGIPIRIESDFSDSPLVNAETGVLR